MAEAGLELLCLLSAGIIPLYLALFSSSEGRSWLCSPSVVRICLWFSDVGMVVAHILSTLTLLCLWHSLCVIRL